MTSCATCHPAAVGVPQPPELRTVRDSVTSIFSHGTHAARGGANKDCATCHAKIRDATENDIELPRPTAKDCERCHDGKQAFAVTTACTHCHAEPKGVFRVARPTARFRHDQEHAVLVGGDPCTTCHVLDTKTGEVAIAGHAKCISCHADDFGARFPKYCAACHTATEPWRHLRADRGLPDTTEFGASLDHAKHTAACTTCHVLRTATTQLRTPRGHASCVGGACHAAAAGPAPHLDDCNACHRLGLAASRRSRVTTAPWSVAIAFDHTPHAKDATGAVLACQSCHTKLEGPVLTLATPAKATCAPCHDGTRAFKLTGTTCRRCHTGGS
jgi:c(7)-type cytochrome triheme protein